MVGTQTKTKERRLWTEIQKWVRRLQLGEWLVGWEAVEPEEMHGLIGAKLEANNRYRTASVRVSDWTDADMLRHIARHEVLHLVLADMREHIDNMLRDYSPAEQQFHGRQLTDLEEQAVTRLERAFDEFDHIGEEGCTYGAGSKSQTD